MLAPRVQMPGKLARTLSAPRCHIAQVVRRRYHSSTLLADVAAIHQLLDVIYIYMI
eukprot:COSAG06_NODE_4587_length_4122_cov_2.670147_1_plen_55_part_10